MACAVAPTTEPVQVAAGGSGAVLPRSAQIVLFCLLLLALGLLTLDTLRNAPWRARPTEGANGLGPQFRVDLNRASKAELMQVTGIGETTAEHILEYRAQQPFRSTDELTRIHGIGPATLRKLKPFVCVIQDDGDVDDGSVLPTALPPASHSSELKAASKNTSTGSSRAASKKQWPAQAIDINNAAVEDLEGIPWISHDRALEIIRERNRTPFKTVEDLTRVKGIKRGILDKIRDHVTVGEPPRGLAKAE
jgi:competence ComEA-like helix-hairpin-helix protein